MVEIKYKLDGGWEKLPTYRLSFDKLEVIKPLVEGRDVIDCGFAGERPEDFGVHDFICGHAKSCVGVDKNREKVGELKKSGYDVLCQDAEKLDLGRSFDVVFAGELLEHLSSPGLFVAAASRHLRAGGRLVITTPNPYFITMLARAGFGKKVRVNPEHTCWFTPETLESLLERHDFNVEDIIWCQHKSRPWINLLVRFKRNLARTIIVVAVKKDED